MQTADNSIALLNANYNGSMGKIDMQSKSDAALKEQTDKFEAYFVKQILEPNAKIQLLQEKFVEDNFKSLVKEYKCIYMIIFYPSLSAQNTVAPIL